MAPDVFLHGDLAFPKSQYDSAFIYRVGKTVRCDTWCEDRWQECAGGIHFFLTRAEAEAH